MSAPHIDSQLRRIIRRGAELIPCVQQLIARSTASEEATGELARQIGTVASEFLAMRKELWDRNEPLAAEVERLLNFHQQVLEQASIRAFRPRSDSWAELARRFGSGSGDTTERLRQLAAEC